MPKRPEPKRHAFNFSTGRAVCGRPAELAGPLVAAAVQDVTCQVCAVELDRWTRQVSDMVEAAGPKVFPIILSKAGVGTGG